MRRRSNFDFLLSIGKYQVLGFVHSQDLQAFSVIKAQMWPEVEVWRQDADFIVQVSNFQYLDFHTVISIFSAI